MLLIIRRVTPSSVLEMNGFSAEIRGRDRGLGVQAVDPFEVSGNGYAALRD